MGGITDLLGRSASRLFTSAGAHHYYGGAQTRESLLERIASALELDGTVPPASLSSSTPSSSTPPSKQGIRVSASELFPVDQFHVGGHFTTSNFLDKVGLKEGEKVIDIGCGVGGPARLAARDFGAHVTGIDFCEHFVHAASAMSAWTGDDASDFRVADALQTDLPDNSYDKGIMIHVGMNIDDKQRLAAEVARILVSGGSFGIFDIVAKDANRVREKYRNKEKNALLLKAPRANFQRLLECRGNVLQDSIPYPMPFASSKSHCFICPSHKYEDAFESSGMICTHYSDDTHHCLSLMEKSIQKAAEDAAPRHLSLKLVMGDDLDAKMGNLHSSLKSGKVGVCTMVFEKIR